MSARKNKYTPSKIDTAVVVLSPLVATLITVVFKTNLLISTFLFFIVPSVYLSARKPWLIKKSLAFSLVFAIPLTFIIEYMVDINNVWVVPTMFGHKIFGSTPIEDIIWVVMWMYFATIYYEYFIDLGKIKDKVSNKFVYLVALMATVFSVFLLIVFIKPDLLLVNYIYLKVGVVLVLLPLITYLAIFPKLLAKYVRVATYFFSISLLFEISAIYAKQWWFSNESVVGVVELFGQRFPYEEFFFWFVIGAPALLVYYEFFADDSK